MRLTRLARENRLHAIGIGLVTSAIAAIYSVYALILYATYRDTSYDLVIFDQAIRSYSRFHLGTSVIKGLHNGFTPDFSVLGDHFSPLDAVLAPLYWIHDGPQSLLIAQSVLFALAIPWLWVFTRRAFGGSGWKATAAAYLASVAYGLSWPIAAAVAFDYHEVALAPLLIAIALERLQAARLRPALIALGLLLLVKEDMGLLVAGLGLALLVSLWPAVPKKRLVGIALIVVGLVYSLVATEILIPLFGGRANYYWAYADWGQNVPQVIQHALENPRRLARMMFFPGVKFETIKWLLAVFCFLPFLSPLTLAALPLLVERMQADPAYQNWWGTFGQYNAYLVVILVFAAIDGAARLDRWVTRFSRYLAAIRSRPSGVGGQSPETRQGPGSGVVALACCVAICAATLDTVPRFALGAALHRSFYTQTTQSRAAAAADGAVPGGVVVAAANYLGPELSERDTVLMWDGDGYTPPFAAPWVVADVQRPEMTFGSLADQQAAVRTLLRHGYRIVFERDGYLVLHRPGPPHLRITSKPLTSLPAAPEAPQ